MQKRSVIIIIIAIILMVAGVSVYGYFLNSKSQITNYKQIQNSNSKTDSWKTYKNDQYGFEFSYPENVTAKQEGDIVMVHDTRQGWPFDWNMHLYQNDKKMNLIDWINSQFNSFKQESDKDCKIVPADKYGSRVNIKDAYTVLIDAPSYEASCSHVGYYTISPSKLTIVEFPDVQASPELYQDLLSTFKFTK